MQMSIAERGNDNNNNYYHGQGLLYFIGLSQPGEFIFVRSTLTVSMSECDPCAYVRVAELNAFRLD